MKATLERSPFTQLIKVMHVTYPKTGALQVAPIATISLPFVRSKSQPGHKQEVERAHASSPPVHDQPIRK